MDESDISTLIDELSGYQFDTQTSKAVTESAPIQDDDVHQYVLNQAKALVDTGIAAVQDAARFATQSQDPDEISALAELMAATTKALDTLNKKNLLDKKAENDTKLKRIEIQGKKEVAQLQNSGPGVTNQMNVLVASREEIFKKLFEPARNSEIIEICDK